MSAVALSRICALELGPYGNVPLQPDGEPVLRQVAGSLRLTFSHLGPNAGKYGGFTPRAGCEGVLVGVGRSPQHRWDETRADGRKRREAEAVATKLLKSRLRRSPARTNQS